jgi:hypothetical protein
LPYIDKERRYQLDSKVIDVLPKTAGELNYKITKLLIDYLDGKEDGLNYQAINDIVGALELAKLEFVRRVVAPYENSKIISNGEVYPDIYITKKEK